MSLNHTFSASPAETPGNATRCYPATQSNTSAVMRPAAVRCHTISPPRLSRRRLIQGSAAAMCLAGLSGRAQAESGQPPLPVPPLLESRYGQPLFLTLQPGHWVFTAHQRTMVWSINGQYPGPTVRVHNGDNVKLIYNNRLEQKVAMTVCGLQVPGSLLGGVARLIPPGGEWAPVLPIRQPAASLWYRASTPQHSGHQVYNGLLGLWLIDDEHSPMLPLPRHYGVDDFPLIIQDKQFNRFGQPEYSVPSQGGFLGNTLLVNGVENPYLSVGRGWIRLRLVNGSNARRYLIQASDNRPLYIIAGDQGLLSAPVSVQQLSLAPGERREILLDLNDGQQVELTTGESATLIERLRGLFEPSDNLTSNKLLTLKPDSLLSFLHQPLPETLTSTPLPVGLPDESRLFTLTDRPGINGQYWDASRINITTRQNSWEHWTINASPPQPFHLEGARFQILSINDAPPLPEDRGWKDTVWVDGQTKLLVWFNQPSLPHYPMLYSSQTLELADRGSIGQILVTPGTDQ